MINQKINITLNILWTFKFWGIYFKIWNFLKHLLKMPDVYSLCVKIKCTLIKMLQNDILIIGVYWNRGHKCETISKFFGQNSIMKVNYVVLCFLVNIIQIYIWESSLRKRKTLPLWNFLVYIDEIVMVLCYYSWSCICFWYLNVKNM